MARLAGKTAAETIAAMTATFRRLDPRMRGSVTFDNDICFARHMLLRGILSPSGVIGTSHHLSCELSRIRVDLGQLRALPRKAGQGTRERYPAPSCIHVDNHSFRQLSPGGVAMN